MTKFLKTVDGANPHSAGALQVNSPLRDLDEPFPCPACGQMLAASVRVCVACKQPVDPSAIRVPAPAEGVPRLQPTLPIPLEPVRFSWGTFLVFFGMTWLAAIVCVRFLGAEKSQFVFLSVQVVSSTWVFFDARQRPVAKPFRWALGSLLLWIVVFPWYLSRRRTPQRPCPFIEGEAGPRVLFVVLLLVILLGTVIAVLKGAAGK